MNNNKATLTAFETVYLASFRRGMDQADCGWLHEMAPENKTTSGVMSSLTKKGLIDSRPDPTDSGIPDIYWVEVTDAGKGFEFTAEQMEKARGLMMSPWGEA
jgi:hypothetical protein